MTEDAEGFEQRERDIIAEAEIELEETYDRKDLKENRGHIKEQFYAGSKKTKHTVVKNGNR